MKRKAALLICLALALGTAAFIFYNSALPTQASAQSATDVADRLASVLPQAQTFASDKADWRSFVQAVRKAAHAVEFFVLGTELAALFLLLHRRLRLQTLWNTLSAALAVAVADESIQILSGRGPRVQDVLLDFCGALCAAALVWLLYGAALGARRLRRRKTLQKTGEEPPCPS